MVYKAICIQKDGIHVSTTLKQWRASESEINFLEQLKTKYGLESPTDQIHKAFELLFEFLNKEENQNKLNKVTFTQLSLQSELSCPDKTTVTALFCSKECKKVLECPQYLKNKEYFSTAEKPAEARGKDDGVLPIEQQSPSSVLPQQAQQPFKPIATFNPNLSFAKPQQERTRVCAHGIGFPTENQCHVCTYKKYCNYSSANKDFINTEAV